MRLLLPLILLIFLGFQAPAGRTAAASPNPWIEAKNAKGISVYHRQILGSERKDVKAVITIPAAAEKVLGVLESAEAASAWLYRLETSEQVDVNPEGKQVYYYHWKLPWPFADQDTYLVRERDSKAGSNLEILRYVYYNNGYPLHEERKRMDDFGCLWEIKTLGERETEVSLTLKVTPQGTTPDWFVTYMLERISTISLRNLSEFIPQT